MRIFKLLIVVLLLSVLHQSCNDYIEVTPENSVTFQDFFQNEADIALFTNSIRVEMKSMAMSPNTRSTVARGFLYDDIARYAKMDVEIVADNAQNMGAIGNWASPYSVASSANILLRHIDKADISEERKDYYKGVAYFYLSFAYLNLSQLWGEAPIVRFDGDIGQKAKESFEDVIDFAIENGVKALELLPAMHEITDLKGDAYTFRDNASKEATLAVLAHAYAWKASMENKPEFLAKSIESCTALIQSPNLVLAANPEAVVTSVLVGDDQESIFEIAIIQAESPFVNAFYTVDGYLTYPLKPEGEGSIKYADFRINNTTVEQMYKNNDQRRDAYFYKFEEQKAKDVAITGGYAYPYKFRKAFLTEYSWGTRYRFMNQNKVYYRLSDIYLLRAECYAKQGENSLAIADMNVIRDRASADLYDASEGDVQLAVFREREKELLWERHRYFDVLRNGYWKTELGESFTNLTSQDIDNGAFFLPVGQGAFNENLLMTQNTFWLGLQ